MPTDDDYGRRERLLLHQHPTPQYGQQSTTGSSLPASSSSSSSSSSATTQQQQQYSGVDSTTSVSTIGIGSLPSGIVTTDCYHKQQQQQQSNQRSTTSSSSTSSVSSNVVCGISSIACHQDRYQISDRLQSNEGISEYGARMSLERYEKINDKQQQQQQHYANKSDDITVKYTDTSLSSRTMQSGTSESGRYVIGTSQDQRFGQSASSSLQIGHHGYGSVSSATGRSANTSSIQTTAGLSQSSVLADRYSRYTEASSLAGDQRLSLQPSDRFQPISAEAIEQQQQQQQQQQHNSYNHGRSSGSSNDERTGHSISNGSKIGTTNEYANSSIIASSGHGIGGGNVTCSSNNTFSPDTFPSPPSPAPASDRFVPPPPLSPSPSEKYASSQSLTAVCYSNASGDRILPPNSPGTRDRYVTAPASPMAMSKDSRYSAMSSDRSSLVAERVQSSLHEAKEHQQQQQRYGASSTERLLSSASPVLGALQARDSENSRCGIFQVAGGLKESSGSNVSSRYSISSDRLVSSSPIHAPVPERFALGAKSTERYHSNESPSHEASGRYHHRSEVASSSVHLDRYTTGGAGSTDRYLSSSPNPEGAHGRYSSTERVLAGSAGNDHGPTRESRRYSTSERSLEGICQKYVDRNEPRVCSSSGSPGNAADYSCRFSGFQEVTMQPRYPPDQRFSDIGSLQRYGGQSNNGNVTRLEQARNNDRFGNTNNERYLSNASPGHDTRLGLSSDTVRYTNCASSTERLLASTSSPSNSDNGRYHAALYGTGTANCTQTKSDRYGPLSPTPENNQSSNRNYSQQSSNSKCNGNPVTNDKYIQVSKSLQISYGGAERYHQIGNGQMEQFDRGQDRGYSIDRYGNPTGNTDQRYQITGNNGGFHNPERYSPGRTGPPDKYLSLPKPKENFVTGRIVTSCSTLGVGAASGNVSGTGNERSYASNATGSYVPPNAHTPVERYVPQPPPEVLYPERYADRYVPPAAHTPTDRYVPAADPGDPYMRRDLGFHHHYRLPPPGYPYHQTHFRFRSFAYASPGRLGGSPGSSSSSSSTSAQREFSTSPLLRPKARNSAIELTNSARQVNAASQATCCTDSGRNCCPPVRRSLPPGALPSIPNQSAHSSWQPSPSSGTTGTSTVSSSGTDGESTQSIGMYAVGGEVVGKSEKSTTTTITNSSPPIGSSNTGPGVSSNGPSITRSVSAPAGPRPTVQQSISTNSTNAATAQRPRLRRNMSRTEALRNYIKRETATFFGVDEESEVLEKQRWLDRRRRMASRKYGALLPEHKPPDPDITRDVPDSTEIPEGVTLRRWQQPVRRKDSVARMTLSGLHYMVETLTRQRPRERSETGPESRSFPPSVISSISQTEVQTTNEGAIVVEDDGEEEAFFQRPPPPPVPPPAPPLPSASATSATSAAAPSQQLQSEKVEEAETEENENNSRLTARNDPSVDLDRDLTEELVRFTPRKEERSSVDGQQVRRPRAITRDHYTSRTTSWRRSRHHEARSTCDPATGSQQEQAGVILRRELSGGTKISPSTIDRVFDNSNRRQYGMGIVGRVFGRSFRKSVAHKPDVRKQLDDIEDHRPYFTYWITTVQVFILIISLACYGFGPVGLDINRRSGLVLVTSLSLQQVDYDEPANFWLGPRAADLIHLGAKFAPCMRRDFKILNEIDVWRERERDTACCIRNDDSGCVQSSKADCSNTISTWKKWGPGDSGPGGRISGSVCGLDPKFCDAPASVAPYEWPDDITKWPICRKTNPFSQRFRSNNGHQQGNNNFPIGRYKDKMAEHMVCEVIGHPCCIGIHGMCRITTKEYCDFVHGYFHEEASLCSQVECLHDVCGMIPFLHPEWPDQFYRLFTTTFLHAGIIHLAITLLVQYFLMRDLEKLTGSLRIALIYFTGALAGNLASAIFIPHRAEVGPAGAHFALLATLVVEVLNCWPMLKHPRRALSKLIMILVALLLLGVLPWVDNYAHLFGFIFGFLAAYALMPFISFGHYDRRRKILLIWICLVLIIGLFALLLALFYNVPVYECEICKLFNCIPFTRDFCASQNINFKKEEPV